LPEYGLASIIFWIRGSASMITEYIQAAPCHAPYELIDDEEPYYGEIETPQGVWATGKTLEECRDKLAEVVDGWILVRLSRGLDISPVGLVSDQD
jgi:predicted RNase H-like HicB family nuclease